MYKQVLHTLSVEELLIGCDKTLIVILARSGASDPYVDNQEIGIIFVASIRVVVVQTIHVYSGKGKVVYEAQPFHIYHPEFC